MNTVFCSAPLDATEDKTHKGENLPFKFPIQRCLAYVRAIPKKMKCSLLKISKYRKMYDQIMARKSTFYCISRHGIKFTSEPFFLTHYRPAMPFGNRKIYYRGSFQFRIVTI